ARRDRPCPAAAAGCPARGRRAVVRPRTPGEGRSRVRVVPSKAHANRRAAGEVMLESELLRVLMDTLPDGIYFKDREGRFIRINAALAGWYGLADPALAEG